MNDQSATLIRTLNVTINTSKRMVVTSLIKKALPVTYSIYHAVIEGMVKGNMVHHAIFNALILAIYIESGKINQQLLSSLMFTLNIKAADVNKWFYQSLSDVVVCVEQHHAGLLADDRMSMSRIRTIDVTSPASSDLNMLLSILTNVAPFDISLASIERRGLMAAIAVEIDKLPMTPALNNDCIITYINNNLPNILQDIKGKLNPFENSTLIQTCSLKQLRLICSLVTCYAEGNCIIID